MRVARPLFLILGFEQRPSSPSTQRAAYNARGDPDKNIPCDMAYGRCVPVSDGAAWDISGDHRIRCDRGPDHQHGPGPAGGCVHLS